jgi:hypothetical protein
VTPAHVLGPPLANQTRHVNRMARRHCLSPSLSHLAISPCSTGTLSKSEEDTLAAGTEKFLDKPLQVIRVLTWLLCSKLLLIVQAHESGTALYEKLYALLLRIQEGLRTKTAMRNAVAEAAKEADKAKAAKRKAEEMDKSWSPSQVRRPRLLPCCHY